MSSLVCNKTVLDPRHYEGGSLSTGAIRTVEAFGMSDYENPLWLRVIRRLKGILFVIAVAYILCFTSTTLLITFLEIDVETILASDSLFHFGFWLLGASVWIVMVGWILRRKTVGTFREVPVRGRFSLGEISND